MRVKKFVVTDAQINALTNGQEIVVDVTIAPNQLNNDSNPRIVRIDNASGGSLGYVVIGNNDEIVERATNPEWYAPIPLGAGTSDLSFGTGCRKFIIVQLDATTVATDDITLYFANYFDY